MRCRRYVDCAKGTTDAKGLYKAKFVFVVGDEECVEFNTYSQKCLCCAAISCVGWRY